MPNTSKDRPEKLMVCVGPSPAGTELVKAAGKMAADSQSEWLAVYVETPGMLRLPEAERNRAVSNLRLAEQLGAETITLRGSNLGEEIANFARHRGVTRIIAGKPGPRPRWRQIFSPGLIEELAARLSDHQELQVVSREPAAAPGAALPVQPKMLRGAGYERGIWYLILSTGLCFLMFPYFDLPNLIMVYLLAVLVTAVNCGRGPAILNSFLSVLTFDFCFVPPRWSFTVDDAKYLVTFVVMFVVAVIISHLAALIRRQAQAAHLQERQTAAMYALSRQLAGARGSDQILDAAVKQISQIFACQAVALLPDEKGKLHPASGEFGAVFQKDVVKELAGAQQAFEAGEVAGFGTRNLPGSPILYAPLPGTGAAIGLLALRPKDPEAENWLLPEQLRLRLIESLARQVALTLEVERLGAKI